MSTAAQTKPWWHYRPKKQCWPLFEHKFEERDAGPAKGGWANGEPTFTVICRVCGEVRGPFVKNSGDAGF